MLIGTIDLFIPFWVTLTLQGVHKVRGKQNPLASCSHFWTDQDEIWGVVEAIVDEHSITFKWDLLNEEK